MRADSSMRRVEFGFIDRLTVSWLELVLSLKAVFIGTVFLLVLMALIAKIPGSGILKKYFQLLLILFWSAIISGTVLNAIFLPYLPGRAFSVKGGILGAMISAAIIFFSGQNLSMIAVISFILLSAGISAFLALNFTGASTYTSISGVKKEIRYAIPAIWVMIALGALLGIIDVIRRLL